jgi:hypothetical protein
MIKNEEIISSLNLFFKDFKIDAEVTISYESFNRKSHPSGRQERTSVERLLIYFKNVPRGFPELRIASKVILGGFFRLIFAFAYSEKRIKIKNFKVNDQLDFFYKDNLNTESVQTELKELFTSETNLIYEKLKAKNLNFNLTYDLKSVLFETLQVPQNKTDLENLKDNLKLLVQWLELFKKIKPNPKLSVVRIGNKINPELAKEIKWSHPSNGFSYPEYPELIHDFISVISSNYWVDYDYSKQPVQAWLDSPEKLSLLSENEIKSLFTFFVRQERFCDGFWQTMVEKEYVHHVLGNPIFSVWI